MAKYRFWKRSSAKKRLDKKTLLLLGVSVVCLAVGVDALARYFQVKHGGIPSPQKVATVTSSSPSEQKVPATYSVPADQPLSINLPTINTTGFIQRVGVDKTNAMVAPGNVNMTGWYIGGAKPGQPGLSIIDGHVHGLYAKGVFYNLVKLKAGDKFTVTYGDHSVKNFQVKSVATVPVAQATQALFARDTSIPSQLNLITCGGTYVAASKSYNGRVIVVSSAI
jgi:sortase (surface protein transpeptidase)